MKLYKYRTLSNIRWLIDILVNNRLYATTYDDFEDEMEGHYYSNNISEDIIHEFRNAKKQARICSLCKSTVIQEMWQEYASDGNGICLQIQVKNKGWESIEIPYRPDLLHYDELNEPKRLSVLQYKLEGYIHESEVRYIKFVKSNLKRKIYLPIIIKKIYLGYKMPDDDKNMIRTFVKHLSSNNIIVEEIDKNNIKPYKEL